MKSQRFDFAGADGQILSGRLDLPDGPVGAAALFAHCFTCSKDIHAARRIARRLTGQGIAVLRFDFTGLGHSEGEFSNTTFRSNVADLEAAAQAMETAGHAPQMLIGHSFGGTAVLVAAPRIASVRAVVTLGAPFDPAHVVGLLETGAMDADTHEVAIAGRPFRVGRAFLDDLVKHNLRESLPRLRPALLVMHAPTDATVGIENATQIFVAARHPKSFVSLDTADHLITREADAEYAADVIAAWAARYLAIADEPAPVGAPEGVVRVREADPNGFLQDISGGQHHFLKADEPVAQGGTNRGLTPYGLLSAALGACTSMTIRMYARRKGIALDGLSVDVTHDKQHVPDMEGGAAQVDHFTRVIHLDGDLDAETRTKLLSIADRCPVHRTLERSSRILTSLA